MSSPDGQLLLTLGLGTYGVMFINHGRSPITKPSFSKLGFCTIAVVIAIIKVISELVVVVSGVMSKVTKVVVELVVTDLPSGSSVIRNCLNVSVVV